MIRIVTTTPMARIPPKTAANGASVPVADADGGAREGAIAADGAATAAVDA
jgi:hypothetical protein